MLLFVGDGFREETEHAILIGAFLELATPLFIFLLCRTAIQCVAYNVCLMDLFLRGNRHIKCLGVRRIGSVGVMIESERGPEVQQSS